MTVEQARRFDLVAFDVDGVLLLDAERERMHAVTFTGFGRSIPTTATRWFLWVVVVVVGTVLLAWTALRDVR